jgi:hypothetical protein
MADSPPAPAPVEAALAGHRDKPRMQLLRWRSIKKGFVVGFADVELPIGLKIVDVMVVAKDGRLWANLPSRPRLRGGQLEVGHDGRPVYEAVLGWRSRELGDEFSRRVIDLVREAHPADLPRGAVAAD